jgi:hypothetical protein
MKICGKCKIEKELDQFTKNKTKKDGKCVYCRSCYAEINKAWRQNNPDRDKKIHQKWKQNNPDKVRKNNLKSYYNNHEKRKSKSRQYKQDNKNILRIKHRLYTNKKYYEDIEYRLKILIRGRIWKALKRNSKQSSSLELLGCSINDLKIYLEKQFIDGMNWNNYGQWHIDHIKPCASFDLSLETEQKICFHYTNLQPLWAKDNIRKSNKII